MEAVGQHLNKCSHCRREIAQLEGYLAELAPTLEPGPLERVADRVRVLVARLVSGGSGGGLPGQLAAAPAYAAPAHAGLRGDESGAPLVYQTDGVQVIVEIETDSERPDLITVLGLVLGLDETSRAEGPRSEGVGFEAHLWQGGQRVATTPVDELGNFILPALLPGTYELILAGFNLEIVIQDIPVSNVKTDYRDKQCDV
jgi:hypothetical protein